MKLKLLIIILFMINTTNTTYGQSKKTLWNYLNNSYSSDVTYQKPSPQNLTTAQNLFKSLLTNRVINLSDITGWKKLGFSILEVIEDDDDYAIIVENKPLGGGFYVVKLNKEFASNILEAPHRPTDLYTHEIVYKLFIEGDFIAAAINTTSRSSVDLGKESFSYFNAFTRAVALSFPAPKIIQLHAFDTDIRDLKADLVLSSTKKEDNALFDKVANCLKNKLVSAKKTYLTVQYPKDIQELGGSLNITAINFYGLNKDGIFFHVETSKDLRDELRISPDLRANFYKCMLGQVDD